MAESSRSRRSARGARKFENETGDATSVDAKNSVAVNRAKVSKRLAELTLPVLEKYGQPAFDELHSRLERVVREFTDEVQALFNDLVGQAKVDHDRLMGLLKRDASESEGETAGPAAPEDAAMSEYERKLEGFDQAEGAAGEGPADGGSNDSSDDEG